MENTITINRCIFANLVRDSEQLRILKNFVALEDVVCKSQIETLIKAMEEQYE